MDLRVLSLLVIVSPPFNSEGKTSDIFQTYPIQLYQTNVLYTMILYKKYKNKCITSYYFVF